LIAPEGKWADFIRTTLENSACTVNKIPDPATDLLLLDEILAAQTLPSLGKLSGKTLILSAAPRVEKITEYLQAGIKDVVLKPYTATELKEILAQFSA
jgi:response regulator of citrate/malate metabolism